LIQIIDNFFDSQIHLDVKNFCKTKLFYSPAFTADNNYYGLRSIVSKLDIIDLFKEQAKKKFKINISKIHKDTGIDIRNLDKLIPHKDPQSILNLFIMIQGDEELNNGIVFYDDKKINTHIGFKENRAILFNSDIVHSPFIFKEQTIKRITATLFITDYKFI